MNNKEILQKAIEKAVENAYDPRWNKEDIKVDDIASYSEVDVRAGGSKDALRLVWFFNDGELGRFLVTEQVIFSHDFAKAFWGEGEDIIDIIIFYAHHYQPAPKSC